MKIIASPAASSSNEILGPPRPREVQALDEAEEDPLLCGTVTVCVGGWWGVVGGDKHNVELPLESQGLISNSDTQKMRPCFFFSPL